MTRCPLKYLPPRFERLFPNIFLKSSSRLRGRTGSGLRGRTGSGDGVCIYGILGTAYTICTCHDGKFPLFLILCMTYCYVQIVLLRNHLPHCYRHDHMEKFECFQATLILIAIILLLRYLLAYALIFSLPILLLLEK